MVKNNQAVWVFIFCCLMFLESSASNSPSATPQQILQCQLSLRQISIHLRQIAKDRTNQKYYANLYQQTQDFLRRLDASPLNSLEAEEMWGQCQNLTKAIRCIMWHPIVKEIPSPVPQGNCPSGQLTARRLNRTTVREIRRYRHRDLRYVCHDHATTAKPKLKVKKDKTEEEDNAEDLALISSPLPKKGLRMKSIDELENRD